MSPTLHFAARALLGLPAMAYGGAVRLRNRLYDTQVAVRRTELPVLSVGNLTVGGTGKTPVVAWLVRSLQAEGWRPAVVSRGYGGAAGRGPLLVSDGSGPRVGPEECGDEPDLLARWLPGAVVVVGSDRLLGTRAARAAGANVIVLDDGFQHRRLARDLDLVLLDAHSPFGNYRLLPAGTLREPLSGLARASAVLITRSRPDESLVVIERIVRRHNPTAPILRAGHNRVGFVDTRGNTLPRPRRAVVFCGIGNPSNFVHDIEEERVEIAALKIFPDHHRYTPAELAELHRVARQEQAVLVTTEKDLARLSALAASRGDAELAALRIEAHVHDPEALLRLVRAALAKSAA